MLLQIIQTHADQPTRIFDPPARTLVDQHTTLLDQQTIMVDQHATFVNQHTLSIMVGSTHIVDYNLISTQLRLINTQ